MARTPATHHCRLYQHLLAGAAQQGMDYPAAPAQPPCQLHVMLLPPEPSQTAPVPQLGELRRGKSPLGAERQMGRAGLLLASDAEMGRAGCLLAGGRSSESIKGIAVAAPQLQQSSTEWLACSLGVAEASPSHLGFFHQLWCI